MRGPCLSPPQSTNLAVCLLAGLLLATGIAHAAEAPVRMVVPPALGPGRAAMPLIADPDLAGRRINAAMRRLDATLRKAAAACLVDGGKPGDWTRTVDVSMRGPGFVSYVVTDDAYCGGPHPDDATMAIVYDLHTGAPVDWTRLLPPALTGQLSLASGMDGTKTVTLASARLYGLFLAAYDRVHAQANDAECRNVVRQAGSGGPPGLSAWLDGKQGGLTLQLDVAHAVQACGDPVLIPLDTLRAEGARPMLVDALAAAMAR